MKRSTAVAMVLAIAVGALLGVVFTRKPSGRATSTSAGSRAKSGTGAGTKHAPAPSKTQRGSLADTGAPESGPAPAESVTTEPEKHYDPSRAYLIGAIVDAAGRPLPGAHLQAQKSARATSGEDGKFRLGPLDPEPVVQVALEASGHLGERFEVAAPAPGLYDVGTLRLSEGAAVEGRVLRADGGPGDSAGVRALPSDEPQGISAAVPACTSSSDGAFRLAGLRPGTWAIVAERGEEIAAREVSIESASGAVRIDDLVLGAKRARATDGAVLKLIVRDASGRPVAGALVAARDAAGANATEEPGVKTGPDGTATLALPAGRVYVTAKRAHSAATLALDLERGPREAEIRLGEGGALAGRVASPTDTCTGVFLSLDAAGAPPGTPSEARTVFAPVAPDGTFEATHLAPGVYRVAAGRDPYSRAPDVESLEVPVREGEVARVSLGPAAPAPVRIRTSGLSGAEVTAAAARRPEVYDAAGLFVNARVRGDAREYEADLPGGPLVLTIWVLAPDGGGVFFPCNLPAPRGETVEISFPAERGALLGRLALPPNATVPDLQVRATGAEVFAVTRCGPTGRFRFPPLPPGRYLLSAAGFGEREAAVSPGATTEITLEVR